MTEPTRAGQAGRAARVDLESGPHPTVYYVVNGGRGWATVDLLAQLTARLIGASLVRLDGTRGYSRSLVLRGLLPRVRHPAGGPGIVIAPHPGHLNAVLTGVPLRSGHSHLSAWVIDSFWTERIPRLARRGYFDEIFVTDGELVDHWQRATGSPVHWLPFGSDVLGRGSASATRVVDVQRVGRQPAGWADDAATATQAAAVGLIYRGRVPFSGDDLGDQTQLQAAMAAAKFTVSFSNTAAPAVYTHPHREYLTGRWTDALGAGSTVAGIAPQCAASERLLWPGATLELETTDVGEGLRQISAALADWSPARVALNHLRALERLDWRWRISELTRVLGVGAPILDAELARLDEAITAGRQRLEGLRAQ